MSVFAEIVASYVTALQNDPQRARFHHIEDALKGMLAAPMAAINEMREACEASGSMEPRYLLDALVKQAITIELIAYDSRLTHMEEARRKMQEN